MVRGIEEGADRSPRFVHLSSIFIVMKSTSTSQHLKESLVFFITDVRVRKTWLSKTTVLVLYRHFLAATYNFPK